MKRQWRERRGRGIGEGTRLLLIAGWLGIMSLVGCAHVEAGLDPGLSDGQTMDSFKAAIREEERAIADLRIELSDRRKDLAEANIARAQLQGMLRESEHRLADARRVIELQREELASARLERERMERSGQQLHSRLRKLERQLAVAKRPADPAGEMIPSGYASSTTSDLPSPILSSVGMTAAVPENRLPEKAAGDFPAAAETYSGQPDASRIIVVQKGETLWRLARRHHVDLHELRQANGLADNHITPGMALRIPVSARVAGIQGFDSLRYGQ